MRICALIICYRDLVATERCLRALVRQTLGVQQVYVVDNSEEPVCSGLERTTGLSVKVITPGCNVGVAEGLNLGFRSALDDGFGWCWTFDQDSEPKADALEELVKCMSIVGVPLNTVGIMASTGISRLYNTLYCGNRARWLSIGRQTDHRMVAYECDLVLTAGSLTNLQFISRGGFFNRDLFIDWVDYDLCMRMKKSGYRIYSCRTSFYYHQIGDAGKIGYERDAHDRERLRMIRGFCFFRNASHVVARDGGVFQYLYLFLLLGREYARMDRSAIPLPLVLAAIWAGVKGNIRNPYAECSRYFKSSS